MDVRTADRLALLALAAAALLYAGPGLLPGRVLLPLDSLADLGAWKPDPDARLPVSNRLLSDPVLQFRPWDLEARRTLSEGRFPWINPYAGEGMPLFANPQAALLSPLTWPRLAFGDWGWGLTVLAKFVLAGLGLYRLARRLGVGPAAAVVSALIYETSAASVVWALYPITNVFVFLPWLAEAAHRLFTSPSAGSALAVAAFAALATSGGHPETLALGVVGLGVWGAWGFAADRAGIGRGRAGLVAAGAASGFLLLGIVLVPFALRLGETEIVARRASATDGGLRVFAVAGQILPGFLGSPLGGEIDLSGAFVGSENFHVRSEGFVGLLALAAVAFGSRRLAPAFRRGLVIGTVFLAIAWRVPPIGFLWSRTPGVLLVAPEYAALVFAFFAALASGPAIEAVVHMETARRLGPCLLAAGALLAGAGILARLPQAQPAIRSAARSGIERLRASGRLPRGAEVYEERLERYLDTGRQAAWRRVGVPGVLWTAGGAALLLRRRRFAIFGGAAVAELLAFGLGYLPAVRRDAIPGTPRAVAAIRRFVSDPSGMFAAAPDVYPPDLGTTERLRDARSYGILESHAWIARLERCGYDPTVRAFPETLSREQAGCLAALGVRVFLSRRPPPDSVRIGGGEPPAVGAYALASASAAPALPAGPPPGFFPGLLTTLAGASAVFAAARAARRRDAGIPV